MTKLSQHSASARQGSSADRYLIPPCTLERRAMRILVTPQKIWSRTPTRTTQRVAADLATAAVHQQSLPPFPEPNQERKGTGRGSKLDLESPRPPERSNCGAHSSRLVKLISNLRAVAASLTASNRYHPLRHKGAPRAHNNNPNSTL